LVRRKRERAFTLIELLTVIAVIGVLAGLLMVAVSAAREKARRTKAIGETRQLASAWKSYWMLYGDTLGWPVGFGGSNIVMNADAMRILLAEDDTWNPQGIVFLDAPPGAINSGFVDPWKNLYTVDFSSRSIAGTEFYETTVFLPMEKRYDHE